MISWDSQHDSASFTLAKLTYTGELATCSDLWSIEYQYPRDYRENCADTSKETRSSSKGHPREHCGRYEREYTSKHIPAK